MYKINYIISKSSFLLFPLKKATGTKLKVIESLALGKQIITNNHGVQGIKLISKEQPLIYKNKKEIINHIKKIENKKKSNTLTKVSNYYKKKYDMSLIFDKFIRSNKI